MDRIAIQSPKILQIRNGPTRQYGADQEWYPTWWQRTSGCGPTTCTHLLWYLSQTRSHCRPLCNWFAGDREGMVELMRRVWKRVTPSVMGVHRPEDFALGARRYGQEWGAMLKARVLAIPDKKAMRPHPDALAEYLHSAFADDLPVAFLNRSHGELANLPSWHWVTLVGFSAEKMQAEMYDQGRRDKIYLGLWLRTAAMGGGFVALEPLTDAPL